jgi:hypothetical protein
MASTIHRWGIIGQRCSRFDTEGSTSSMETVNTEQLSSRLREPLCEPAMLDLTKRLIAILISANVALRITLRPYPGYRGFSTI